ncbi:Uncharacterised protein [Bacillus subtilis]|nr:Uncharacterised protein [Bacillus subtilis]
MSKLASEYVANFLNEWYMAIKQQNVEAAENILKKSNLYLMTWKKTRKY